MMIRTGLPAIFDDGEISFKCMLLGLFGDVNVYIFDEKGKIYCVNRDFVKICYADELIAAEEMK